MSALLAQQCIAIQGRIVCNIGDTGLLDHLLKHLADKTVTTAGDKLRRRHNSEGHMEYWLQSAASAHIGKSTIRSPCKKHSGTDQSIAN